ncbi:Putative MetA-pathway of phenol degradation [Solimonas aquatica]|uniref:Putative MetA-pathway of phenol degradation n=1 Tax=Solimonas aquatica TaxID=489703 RepID=A0A1H9AS71_9GAMM|nr:transporter [Solimonas aquatica]SEP79596.1 Putative MetA-pathway of phenol degradation [Solimonas aquatica]
MKRDAVAELVWEEKRYPCGLVLLLAGAALLACARGHADGLDAISTDRPDTVESSLTVGRHRLQLETSVAYEHDAQDGESSDTWSAPTLLRYGVSDSWELRIETDGPLHERLDRAAGETNASGMGDLALGLKHHLRDREDSQWSRALLLHLDLPSGDGHWKGHKHRPSLRYVAEHDLGENAGFGIMPGLVYNTDDSRDYYLSALLAATVGYSFSEQWRGFVELASTELGAGHHADTQNTFDGGLAWIPRPDLQFDVVFNLGLSESAPDLMLGTGVSVRW